MSKRHAIVAAQDELHRLGLQETVINVYRSWEPRRVIVVADSGKKHVLDGHVAIKLAAILMSRPRQVRREEAPTKKRKDLAPDYRSTVSRMAEDRVPAREFWAAVNKAGTK